MCNPQLTKKLYRHRNDLQQSKFKDEGYIFKTTTIQQRHQRLPGTQISRIESRQAIKQRKHQQQQPPREKKTNPESEQLQCINQNVPFLRKQLRDMKQETRKCDPYSGKKLKKKTTVNRNHLCVTSYQQIKAGFNATITNRFKALKETAFKELKESVTIDQQIDILNDIKLLKVLSEILQLKSTIAVKKISVKGLFSRLESAEERSSEL